jgi:hypothetical protein
VRIEELEAQIKKDAMQYLSDTGQMSEAIDDLTRRHEHALRKIDLLEEKFEVAEGSLNVSSKLWWQSSQRIGEAMYRLHKLKYWLDMDQELFDAMTDQQQADHKYVQTAVDGIIWALKGDNQ